MVIGAGAVGLAAVQGARLAGAGRDHRGRSQPGAAGDGASAPAPRVLCDPAAEDPAALARSLTAGRGADVVIEAAGVPQASALASRRCGPAARWSGSARSG